MPDAWTHSVLDSTTPCDDEPPARPADRPIPPPNVTPPTDTSGDLRGYKTRDLPQVPNTHTARDTRPAPRRPLSRASAESGRTSSRRPPGVRTSRPPLLQASTRRARRSILPVEARPHGPAPRTHRRTRSPPDPTTPTDDTASDRGPSHRPTPPGPVRTNPPVFTSRAESPRQVRPSIVHNARVPPHIRFAGPVRAARPGPPT